MRIKLTKQQRASQAPKVKKRISFEPMIEESNDLTSDARDLMPGKSQIQKQNARLKQETTTGANSIGNRAPANNLRMPGSTLSITEEVHARRLPTQ